MKMNYLRLSGLLRQQGGMIEIAGDKKDLRADTARAVNARDRVITPQVVRETNGGDGAGNQAQRNKYPGFESVPR
jgi:hypothetical protein